MKEKIRVRLAPSPTGFVHVGTIYIALFDYVFAKRNKGNFILRVEDTDQTRYVEGAEQVLYESLEWLGLLADEGPHVGGDFGPYRQSERLDIYKKYAHELIDRGKAYFCFCSVERLKRMRKKQQALGEPTKYDRKCLNLSGKELAEKLKGGAPYVIRLKVPNDLTIEFNDLVRGKISFDSNNIDDQILLKSDGYPTYHLAVVVDDHLMDISHIIRAEEWISSTPKHILLYEAFGWEVPQHAHLPLLRNLDRSKISKRHGHSDLRWYKKEGYLPKALLNFLALLGWSHPEEKEVFDINEMIKHFDFKRFSKTGPIFDIEKLNWLNGVYIRQLSVDELREELLKYQEAFKDYDKEYLLRVITLEQERMKKLSDFEKMTKFFFVDKFLYNVKDLIQKGRDEKQTLYILKQAKKFLEEEISSWDAKELEKTMRDFLKEFPDWTAKQLFMTIRMAITGKTATPPLFETMEVLGKDRTVARIAKAILYLENQ